MGWGGGEAARGGEVGRRRGGEAARRDAGFFCADVTHMHLNLCTMPLNREHQGESGVSATPHRPGEEELWFSADTSERRSSEKRIRD